jgi:1,4-dihydroxy-2-naphthoate octaprenyltransferase
MRKILYYTTRTISIVLVLPALIIGIPSFCIMIISDMLDPDPYNLKRK